MKNISCFFLPQFIFYSLSAQLQKNYHKSYITSLSEVVFD